MTLLERLQSRPNQCYHQRAKFLNGRRCVLLQKAFEDSNDSSRKQQIAVLLWKIGRHKTLAGYSMTREERNALYHITGEYLEIQ